MKTTMPSSNVVLAFLLFFSACECGPRGNAFAQPKYIGISTGPEAFSSNIEGHFTLNLQISAPVGAEKIEELFQAGQPVRLFSADNSEVPLSVMLQSSTLATGAGFTMTATVGNPLSEGWYELVIDRFFSQFTLDGTSRFHKRADGLFSAFYHIGSNPVITDFSVQGEGTLSIHFSETTHLVESSAVQITSDTTSILCTLNSQTTADGIEKVFDCSAIPDSFSIDVQAAGTSGIPVSLFSGTMPLAVDLTPVPDTMDSRAWTLWAHLP